MEIRDKLWVGLKVDLAILIIDWIGRAALVSQFGVKIVLSGPLASVIHAIFGIPTSYFFGILLALYVGWLLAPERFPRFSAVISRVYWQNPPTPPDLYAAIVICISNFGYPSTILDFEVSASRVNGTKVKVDVAFHDQFDLVLNAGKDFIRYTENHLITARTRYIAVQRGVPITGVLLCLFRDVQDDQQIDVSTIRVRFKDGIGDGKGTTAKWWEAQPLAEPEQSAVVQREKIIGLPGIQPTRSP